MTIWLLIPELYILQSPSKELKAPCCMHDQYFVFSTLQNDESSCQAIWPKCNWNNIRQKPWCMMTNWTLLFSFYPIVHTISTNMNCFHLLSFVSPITPCAWYKLSFSNTTSFPSSQRERETDNLRIIRAYSDWAIEHNMGSRWAKNPTLNILFYTPPPD